MNHFDGFSNGNFDGLGVRKRWDTVLSKGEDISSLTFITAVSLFLCPLAVISSKLLLSHIKYRLKMCVSVYKFRQLVIVLLILKKVGYTGHDLVQQIAEIHLCFYKDRGDLIILSGKKTQLIVCIRCIISSGQFRPVCDTEGSNAYSVDLVGLGTSNTLGAVFLHSQSIDTADKNAV